jgi:hypothetical protein
MNNDIYSELGFDVQSLYEGLKRTLRRLKSKKDEGALDAAEREVKRQGHRSGRIKYNKDTRKEYEFNKGIKTSLPRHELKREEESLRALKFNRQEIALAAYPNIPGDRYDHFNKSAKLDRTEISKMGKAAESRTTAAARAEDIYNEQPVVKAKDDREKDNFLRTLLRMQDLGLA